MIALIADIRIKAGGEAEFEAGFAELTAGVRAEEPGAHLYQLTRSRTEPGRYKVLELYEDDAALEAHRASEHYRAGGARIRELAAGPVEVEVFDAVG